MSRVGDLISELSPYGVPYLPIGDSRVSVCVVAGATPESSRAEYWENGTIPWMSSGEVNKATIHATEKLITKEAYSATSTKLVPPGAVVVALAGQGKTRGTVARTRIELCTNQSLASIVLTDEVDSDFLFHFLRTQYAQLRDVSSGEGTRGGLNLQMIRAFKVPVPPLPIQREIARVLNQFTQLEAELEAELAAELAARRTQYDFYRDSVVGKSRFAGLEWVQLGTVANIRTGAKPDDTSESGVFPYVNAGNEPSGFTALANSRGDTITIPSRGQGSAGHVGYQAGDFWCGPLCYRIDSKSEGLLTRFLYFYLRNLQDELIALRKVGSIPAVNKSDLTKVLVPVLAVEDQQRVVEMLDRFDALVNDLGHGLPAEINARRKQYEYYRDRLLTFEERVA